MKRIHLFEFEDLQWFPKWMRTSMTNVIVVFHKVTGTQEVVANLLKKVKRQYDFKQIVDIGAGSGGIMPKAVEELNGQLKGEPVKLLLTDLYPNPDYIKHINDNTASHIHYQSEPLDATHLDKAPQGLKTMMNSFHHMPPPVAKNILLSAQRNKEPLLIYEMAENNIPTIAWWLFLPLSLLIVFIMALVLTLKSRPLTAKQLIFTYLIPIIPLCYAWDGQVSMIRMYTFDDIKELLHGEDDDDYVWTMETAMKENGKKQGYYILGLPKA